MSTHNEKIRIYEKQVEQYIKRRNFTQENNMFELNRRQFYRSTQIFEPFAIKASEEKIKNSWSNMWEKKEIKESYDEYLHGLLSSEESINFPTFNEFQSIISLLPNWKAARCDGIYNFFIKNDKIHLHIYEIIYNNCINGFTEEDWFYSGITYLIPKSEVIEGNEFRPITYMSNLYKMTTKVVTNILTLETEARNLITENQLGTKRRVQGAKEQALVNIALNTEYENKLHTT